ncbi:MAG: type III-A CRISPR-associated protein Cas10/Csm1 [bacterium]
MMKGLNNDQKKEYQAVILAALLHDIGKFLHRGDGKYEGELKHEKASAKFIEKFYCKLQNNALYDLDLVRLLLQYHNQKDSKLTVFKDPYLNNANEEKKEKIWKLITLVRDGDTYSCAERDLEQDRKKGVGSKRVPLDSIFSQITLDMHSPKEKNFRYHETLLSPIASFPEEFDKLNDKEVRDLINDFEKKIPDFSLFKNFNDILNYLLNLLEQYTWAVPSDTRYEFSDVSLYDHLRSSAAIAACLYKRHLETLEEGKNFNRKNELVFIGADFSGIQDYIFEVTNRGFGGAAKRLRARSLFIFLFSEVCIHRILHALDLPLICNLFSAGGKFLLLAPNINGIKNGIKEILQKVKTDIEEEINKTFFNQFSFLMAWMEIEGFKQEFKVYNFFDIADKMFHKLESEKVRKFENVLKGRVDTKDKLWNVAAFKAEKIYSQYNGNGDCNICGKGPATFRDDDETTCCFICHQDKHKIGAQIPKTNYIAFGTSSLPINGNEKIVIFHCKENSKENSYFVELLREHKENNNYYLIYDIRNSKRQVIPKCTLQPIKKYLANHVPFGDDKEILCFEEIATQSIWQRADEKYGSTLLGILKADIDNLGLIFSKGFDNPRRAEKGLNNIDKKSVSRFLTLSRMTELFFSGWMKEIMFVQKKNIINTLKEMQEINHNRFMTYLEGEQINFKNIYTVYSGGDDLVLIGPWETMIIFSIFLNMQFRKFTCNNNFITLSAGLTFIKPKHPVASGIKQAEILLEKSKEKGKNRITFFGTTIRWGKLAELLDFFLFFNEKLNEKNPRINAAFLYRLLEYHRMALTYFDEDNIIGLKYLSALSYDIGRNIIEKNKEGNIKVEQEEYKMLQSLINEKPTEDSLINYMKIPLFWALFRNRKIKSTTDENTSNF